MYRFLLLYAILFFTTPLFCQRNNFAVGFQTGNNVSRTVITKEFPNSPLKSDYFIGSSFGLVARNKLFSYKWNWARFSEHIQIYMEYGVNVSYGGYNYRYNDQTTFQEQITYGVPLLFVMRPIHSNYWYKSFKGKRIYPIVKGGFNFIKTKKQNIEKVYNFGEATLIENVQIDDKINPSFVGALGFQKEFKNGRIMYIGFSAHVPFEVRTQGTIRLNSPQINEIAQLAKAGNFFSIDLQYFIGKRTKREGRNNKRRKLPKIIYNPRYF